jgi:hypothetical protein
MRKRGREKGEERKRKILRKREDVGREWERD